MALVLKDRVRETSTTTGTGSFTLGGTSTGFQSFSVIGDGNTTYYGIVNSAAGEWEVGVGTYTASGTVLSRDTILESSNGGSAVDFSAGTKDVFVTYPAERSASTDTFASPPAIGSTTPAAGTFTTLTATGQTDLGVNGSNNQTFRAGAGTGAFPYVSASHASASARLSARNTSGNSELWLSGSGGTGTIRFFTNNLTDEQFRVGLTASAVNYVQVTGAATGNNPTISAQGSDATRGLAITTKGASGVLDLQTGGTSRIKVGQSGTGIVDLGISASGGIGFQVTPTTSQVNYFQAAGAVASSSPILSAQGSDTNIDLNLTPKGTGTVVANGPFTATGQTSLGGVAGSESLRATTPSVTGAWLQVTSASNTARIRSASDSGNTALWLSSVGSEIRFQTNSWATEQMRISHTASAVNYVQVTGAATGGNVVISSQGSDTNVNMLFDGKGSGNFQFQGNTYLGTNGANNLLFTGAATTLSPSMSAVGSDTNIDLTLTPKGTGAVKTSSNITSTQTVTAATVVATDSVNAPNTFGFKNRIINGAMMIDQRNAGASVTPASGAYLVDRFYYGATQASKFTAQRNAGSVTPPAGFTNYLGLTVASAVSVGAADTFYFGQIIEGFNIADLAWGTANAQAVTISFWVRSSLTGTHSGTVGNTALARTYPFSFTISAANTWEQKTVSIVGDTSSTWATDNTAGLYLLFNLGSGANFSGTAGSWTTSTKIGATGATSVVGTSGATFYITGVQLEKGSTATSFDYRPYGTELALCQRYFEVSYDSGTAVGAATLTGARYSSGSVAAATTSYLNDGIVFKVSKRTTPTVTLYDSNGTINKCNREYFGAASTANQSTTLAVIGFNQALMYSTSGVSAGSVAYQWTASAEL